MNISFELLNVSYTTLFTIINNTVIINVDNALNERFIVRSRTDEVFFCQVDKSFRFTQNTLYNSALLL